MAKLEELVPGASVRGIIPNAIVTIINVNWHGDSVIEITYRDSAGHLGNQLLYRDSEPTVEIVVRGRPWSFDGEGKLLRLVSEANRIRLAYLFDPVLAVHTSILEPLPHQITAVYGEMIPRQPLRFLLADDPGAGKTIMAGLFIKELYIRGDLERCLIICPGNLVEQWQDELYRKFNLPFNIMTNDNFEAARTGNWFKENPLAICRLDKLSRNEDVQAKLSQTDWDLVVCDEAHKMSASFFGGEVKYTKRHKLGQLVSQLTRHFLLMTATPHNGKEEDFQLFMSLLDGDRFEGRFRDGVHVTDTSDLMRRMVKEELLKFDGTPLFPERKAYTVQYKLSDPEAKLYHEVTEYVREEFNRADKLENEGRKGNVGFALTTLQRRLASSPEAIYQSLKNRRQRLEKRLREEEILARGGKVKIDDQPIYSAEDLEDIDDAPDSEVEDMEEQVVDKATAAQTIEELKAEIATLKKLEALAFRVKNLGTDKKWDELSALLQNNDEMFDAEGHRRKLIIFTEHRPTLQYLVDRIKSLLGRDESVVAIHGGMGREDRKKAENAFTQDKEVMVLVATDAAGEGINLQRAHLMVNYDLPWNPNRIEQRFGRIHRIGQTEVCHLWNLVAEETREGDVFVRLLEKINQEREALGGQVFDVLGKVTFDNKPLKLLLLEAIRYGERPDVRERIHKVVDDALDREKLRELLEERALARDSMDAKRVQEIREDMERADAKRLQPHFIEAFFMEAFRLLGGTIREREHRRYEIKRVPTKIRARDRSIGTSVPVMTRYERITFEKNLVSLHGKPLAEFVCPGHPLLDATIDIILEQYRELMKRGAILIDPTDDSENARVLFYLANTIKDARPGKDGNYRVVSKEMHFVEMDKKGHIQMAGYAPYLNYRPLVDGEYELLKHLLDEPWLKEDLESKVISYAVSTLVPKHFESVKKNKESLINKAYSAVKDRLTKEINYWDHRANELQAQEQAGRRNARMNSAKARQRADELQARLQKRLEELEQERHLSPKPPVVTGGALIVPNGLLARLRGEPTYSQNNVQDRVRIEKIAMETVMSLEQSLGYEPVDVSDENLGYDIESRIPGKGRLRFIEVKGRTIDASTITVTKNEILTAFNKPDDYILAIVQVDGDNTNPLYVRKPFRREPDFGVTSVTYSIKELIERAEAPS
jgi:superfamily II DNA or RNA helicase